MVHDPILGKPGRMRPVINWYWAAECTTMSPWQERITARSSTQVAVWGKRSDTSMPACPYFLNVRLVPIRRASAVTNWYLASPNSVGRFWPSSLLRAGLGSNVSTWLGPPTMNRKITDFAFGAKCGVLAAKGLTRVFAESSELSAIAPKPCAARERMSRRVTADRMCSGNIDKLIAIQQRQTEVRQT